jgi:mono/diheme cytochrome c family protein
MNIMMLARRFSVPWFVFLATLLATPIIIHLQAGQAISQQAVSPSQSPADEFRATRELYAKHCAQCHGANGVGSRSRKLFPETPDFTNAAWQAGRSDVQFLVSILEGKGTGMPGWGAKISPEQARSMVAFVRTFTPTKKSSKEISVASDMSPASVAERLRLLQEQFAEHNKAFWELSKAPSKASPETINPSPPLANAKTSEPGNQAKPETINPSPPLAKDKTSEPGEQAKSAPPVPPVSASFTPNNAPIVTE